MLLVFFFILASWLQDRESCLLCFCLSHSIHSWSQSIHGLSEIVLTLDTPLIIRWNWKKNKTNQSTVKDNWRSTPTVLVIILIRINPIDSPKKKTKRFSNENIKFIYRFRWSSIKHLGQLSTLEAISIQSFVILFSTYRESFKITHL